MNDAQLLHEVGRAMFGERWQSDLAAALSINPRTVRRWVAGEDSPRPGVWVDLAVLMRARRAEQHRLLARLDDRASQG